MTKEPGEIIEKTKRLHMIVAGDHGQGFFRMTAKILLMVRDSDDAAVISVSEALLVKLKMRRILMIS